MRVLPPLARAEGALEMIDVDGAVSFPELARCMADIARVNGLFGGRMVTRGHVKRLVSRLPATRPVTVLDVGTGAGDIPRALVRWARRVGRPIRVLALDRDPSTLEVARRLAGGYPEISFLRGDALALPVRPGSVDLIISALTLHHLEPDPAVRYFTEMDAAARVGFVVNDLARSRVAHAVVWLITRVVTWSRAARNDGPLSVLRAYTPAEVRRLCEKAGLLDIDVVHHIPFLRLCAVKARA